MTLHVHRLAKAEVQRAASYINRDSAAKRDRFLSAVETAYAFIELNPLTGSPCYGSRRFVRTKKFKYVIYYEHFPTDDRIEVFAVAHGSRKPGYWLRRTRRP